MGRKDLIEKAMLEERSKERKGTIYVRIWCKWYVASVWLVQEEPGGEAGGVQMINGGGGQGGPNRALHTFVGTPAFILSEM